MADEPKWLVLARKEIGTREVPGPKSNPKVMQYYADVVGRKMADAIPWCSAFVGAILVRAGEKSSGSLMARSYLQWGEKTAPKPGCVVVFARGRPPFGHVAFAESFGAKSVTVIGGNQSDAVTRQTYPKSKVLGYRWPSAVIQRSLVA